MKLIEAHIKNFRLLEDIAIEFSVDRQRPLTVIRAENGSGKTSLLYALIWAFYGTEGFEERRALRLTSTASSPHVPVDIQVRIRFAHTDTNGITTEYQLIRTATETPQERDNFVRTPDTVRLLKFTTAGHEEVPDDLLNKLIPRRLRHVFFTNGDDVQRFISGKLSGERQSQVHDTIKMLLGLDMLRDAVGDLESVLSNKRKQTASQFGSQLADAERALAATNKELKDRNDTLQELKRKRARMQSDRDRADRDLKHIGGLKVLDELNDAIDTLESDIVALERQRDTTMQRFVQFLHSERTSWCLLDLNLRRGLDILADLRDRNIIPGTSVHVLQDRLDLEKCICGESLSAGTPHRATVESLLEEQGKVDLYRQQLSQLGYLADIAHANERKRREEGNDFSATRSALIDSLTEVGDGLKGKRAALDDKLARRKGIDEERVRQLTGRLDDLDRKIAGINQDIGAETSRIEGLEDVRTKQEARYREAESKVKVAKSRLLEQDVAEDLLGLARGTLGLLENDYLHRVQDRMQDLFLEIVGSALSTAERHLFSEGEVFTGITISDDFDIVVDSQHGRTLHPDLELNGASQRALTLSFIWAAMQVADVAAPRIIDTPLGMVAGGVKARMVDVITRPSTGQDPDFQVVLLLTRSEVRDIEQLLDARGGKFQTMSCSKDHPVDLVNDWNTSAPVVRVCSCNHKVACNLCARRYDEQHGLHMRTPTGDGL